MSIAVLPRGTVTDECNLQTAVKSCTVQTVTMLAVGPNNCASRIRLISIERDIDGEVRLFDRMGKGSKLYEYVRTSRPDRGRGRGPLDGSGDGFQQITGSNCLFCRHDQTGTGMARTTRHCRFSMPLLYSMAASTCLHLHTFE